MLEKSEVDFKSSLEGFSASGETLNAGLVWGNLGELYMLMGEHERSQEALIKAMEICERRHPIAHTYFRSTAAILALHRDQITHAEQIMNEIDTSMIAEYGTYYCLVMIRKCAILLALDRLPEASDAMQVAQNTISKHQLTKSNEALLELERLRPLIHVVLPALKQ